MIFLTLKEVVKKCHRMNKQTPEFLIDTDVLMEHLIQKKEAGFSALVKLMLRGLCFTTVINAAEVILNSNDEEEEFYSKSLLSALKVLGIHSRYSLNVKKIKIKHPDLRDSLFLVTAEVNKLNVITFNLDKYQSDKINIIHPDSAIEQYDEIYV